MNSLTGEAMKRLRQLLFRLFITILATMTAINPTGGSEQQEPPTNIIKNLISRAKTNYANGDISQARSDINALVDFTERDSLIRLLDLERQIAEFCSGQGDKEQAIAVFERTVHLVEMTAGSNDTSMCLALANLASFYLRNGQSAAARPIFLRCLQIIERAGGADSLETAAICDLLRDCETDLARFREAELNAKRALGIRERLLRLDDLSVIRSRASLAGIHVMEAKFSSALPLVITNVSAQEKDLPKELIESLRGKDRSKAMEDFVTHNREKAILLAESYAKFGLLQRIFGKFAEAQDLVLRSRLIHEQASGRRSFAFANTLILEAGNYGVQQQYELALPLLKQAYDISTSIMDKSDPRMMNLLNDLGLAYKNTAHDSDALRCLEQALAIGERVFGTNSTRIATLLMNVACLYRDEGQYATALPLHKRNMAICERAFGLAHPMTMMAGCHFAIWHIKQGIFPEELFEAGRTLPGWGGYLAAELPSLSDPDALGMIEQFYFLNEGLHSLGDVKFTKPSPMLNFHCAQGLVGSKALLEESDRDRERRPQSVPLNEVVRALPVGAALVDIVEYRRWDYSAKIENWKEKRYAAYLTFPLARDSTNVSVIRVDLGEAGPINNAIELVCKRMSAGQFTAKDLSAALQRLGNSVYEPLARHLTNVTHLIICPDGQLGRLPFEILPVSAKFLVEEKTISYVGSGREVFRLMSLKGSEAEPQRSQSLGRPLVIGNPDFDFDLRVARPSVATGAELKTNSQEDNQNLLASDGRRSLSRDYRGLKFERLAGAEAEARSVAKLIGGDTELRLGEEARESDLKAAQSPRVLHLATHGFYLSDQEFQQTNSLGGSLMGSLSARWNASGSQSKWENPMVRCGIALAGANHAQQISNAIAEDGLLTGLEASLLHLQGTELVILSACDSGTGEVKIGEGLMSLRRAFRIAGAESVLASHWKVSDKATTQLMTEFMRRWRAGQPRAKAWREAQLCLLRSKDYSNPYFWAAFTLTGQWN